ncbi:hypothetical protein FJZ19_03675 [Candidatus Pacearchaeota archaeon]|nr:hypothetical protein [Candidatus Pacearchaeota archaeon]
MNGKVDKVMEKIETEEFGQKDKSKLNFWLSMVERYNYDKVISICIRAGTTPEIAEKIANTIDSGLDEDDRRIVTMSEIRKLIFALLYKYDWAAAKRFKTDEVFIRTSSEKFEVFDRSKISRSLIKETGIIEEQADAIAMDVDKFIKNLNLNYISSPLIREIVCVKLLEYGLEDARKKYSRIGMPIYDIEQMISRGTSTDIKRENANLQHTPETINWIISGETLEQYATLRLLPQNLVDSHISGDYHVHILSNAATRPNCIQHFTPLFFKYGLKVDGTGTHTSVAGPAKHLQVAVQHSAKILLAAQTQMAGGQSIDCFNVWLAPFVKGLKDEEVKQAMQEFIYELNQSYVARGGQVVFSNIDWEFGIPKWLKNVPAIGPGGKEMGVYGDYEEESLKLLREYAKIKIKGDYSGKQHMWPNDVYKVREDTFQKYPEELKLVHDFMAKFGTPYIANGIPEWQTENFNYMGCLSSDTPLPYINDNSNHLSSIKNLAEKYFEKDKKIYGVSVYTEPENLSVFSWNPDKNIIEKKKVLKIIKNPPAKLFEIKTTKGKRIKVTKDHPFFRISRGNYWLKKAEQAKTEELKIGDRIIVPGRIPFFENINDNVDAYSELLGFFIGDGTMLNVGKGNPVIMFNFKADSDHLPYLEEVCKKLNINLEINKTYHSRDKADYVNCYIKDKELCEKFLSLYSEGKKIPDDIFKNSEFIFGFLAGIINSDGYVRIVKSSKAKATELLITTTLENVCNSISLMLSCLGIDYSLRKQENPGKKCKRSAFRISVFGKDAEWLLSKIPLAARHKKKEFLGRNKKRDVKSVKIKEISEIENKEHVYDLEVEGNHTFISGQGLFIHSNCRTRLDAGYAGAWGSIRTGNDIYITLNLPRIAYEARGNDERFFELLNNRLTKMAEILIIKHKITDDLLHKQHLLKFLSQKLGEEEYYNFMNTTKTFGYAGLTEACKFHTGNHLHENKEAQNFGLKVIKRIREYSGECIKNHGLRFSVIASPAETCAARLAKLDISRFGKNVIFSGTKEAPYYTNSHMIKMDANFPLGEKINIEQDYHPITNGGHILHIWLGEQSPSAESLMELTKKICRKNIGFFAYTRDYSICNPCSNFEYGLRQKCGNCGSEDLARYSRITGYYQRVEGWNPAKKQELKDRFRFNAAECDCN